jgi:hypothetical protein
MEFFRTSKCDSQENLLYLQSNCILISQVDGISHLLELVLCYKRWVKFLII